ncbi:uncharacterized protein LOC126666992 isoform X3 [Mercurialis annua]|uniref:uncharacterized protein LOC126666992 isoform X3 n=1 Tax=Mercurialis annua TaxID=3986 RepID=UPI00215FAEE9|nr:uncharacterized protein LOC126666992 isoform X3 [Mercurialis annua]XP_050216333.1 uncharacterized protein LOC126666992 isoform X3 [Mercurialis annua]
MIKGVVRLCYAIATISKKSISREIYQEIPTSEDMNRKTNEISPCLLVFLVQHAYNLQFIFIQFQTNSYMNPRGTMHHLQWYYYKGRNWPATVSFHRRRSVVHLSAACQNSVAMDPVSGAHTPTQVCESVLLVCTWECVRSRLYVLF